MIARGNDSDYGLTSGTWTRDIPKAWRIGRALKTGTDWINTYSSSRSPPPFGGEKESSVGREKGRDGIRAYMAQKSNHTGLSGQPIVWARVAA